jgi:hypothetical protein
MSEFLIVFPFEGKEEMRSVDVEMIEVRNETLGWCGVM